MKKKRIILGLLSAFLAGSSSAGTYAYLTDMDTVGNELSITENEIHIDEKFDVPEAVEPGSIITKAPAIVNDSGIGVYVRMSVRFSDLSAEACCLPLEIQQDWEKKNDGFYYYSRILAPGERTEPLFQKIKVREDVSKEALPPFDVLVYAESVQSFGLSSDAAWKLFEGKGGV